MSSNLCFHFLISAQEKKEGRIFVWLNYTYHVSEFNIIVCYIELFQNVKQ